jgi:ribonuclease Z
VPSHARTASVDLGSLRIEGFSSAGEETWFRVFPPGLALDAGRGAPALTGARELLLSHGHLDHALGVPYFLSQRSLHHQGESRVYCPRELAPALASFIQAAEAMEHARYRYQLVALDPGERVAIHRDLDCEAFRTDHGVPSLGFHLERTKRVLAPEHRHLSTLEVAALRRQGIDVNQEIREIFLTYCGDTGPRVFSTEPRVFTSRVLLLECTFLGDEMRDKSSAYRHLHLDDLAAHADRFENEAIVLHHLSRRHRTSELRAAVDARLPGLASRIHLLGELH